MNKFIRTMGGVFLVGLLVGGSSSAETVLFHDDFENSIVNERPGENDADTGSFSHEGCASSVSGVRVRSGDLSESDGPTVAQSGSNYLELSRLGGLSPDLVARIVDGSAIDPTETPFRVTFYFWSGYGVLSFSLADGHVFDQDHILLTNGVNEGNAYLGYDGEKNRELLPLGSVPIDQWNKVVINWDPTAGAATVSLNDAKAFATPLFGETLPRMLIDLWLSSGAPGTLYWVDNITIEEITKP